MQFEAWLLKAVNIVLCSEYAATWPRPLRGHSRYEFG